MVSAAPKTAYFVLAGLALGFIDGVVAYWFYPGQAFAPSSVALSFLVLFLTFLWYRLDSDSRGFRRTPLLSAAIVGITILALPYYLFRTRGFRNGFLDTLVVLLVGVGYSGLNYIGQLASRAIRI